MTVVIFGSGESLSSITVLWRDACGWECMQISVSQPTMVTRPPALYLQVTGSFLMPVDYIKSQDGSSTVWSSTHPPLIPAGHTCLCCNCVRCSCQIPAILMAFCPPGFCIPKKRVVCSTLYLYYICKVLLVSKCLLFWPRQTLVDCQLHLFKDMM